jgi:hypothetical protein
MWNSYYKIQIVASIVICDHNCHVHEDVVFTSVSVNLTPDELEICLVGSLWATGPCRDLLGVCM